MLFKNTIFFYIPYMMEWNIEARTSYHKLLPTCLPNVVDNLIKKDGEKLKSFFRKFQK